MPSFDKVTVLPLLKGDRLRVAVYGTAALTLSDTRQGLSSGLWRHNAVPLATSANRAPFSSERHVKDCPMRFEVVAIEEVPGRIAGRALA